MSSAIWLAGVLGVVGALAPEIIKGVKAVVTSLGRVGVSRHASAMAPLPGTAATDPRRFKPAVRLLAMRGIVPLHVHDRVHLNQGREEVRAA